MANTCYNNLTITGPKELITALKKAAYNENDGQNVFSLEMLLPTPTEYLDRQAVIYIDADNNGKLICSMYTHGLNSDLVAVPLEVLPSELEEPTEDWYTWRLANWGTKWDTDRVKTLSESSLSWELSFETPWSPPLAALETISAFYPDLEFQLHFTDEQVIYYDLDGLPDAHKLCGSLVLVAGEYRKACRGSMYWGVPEQEFEQTPVEEV